MSHYKTPTSAEFAQLVRGSGLKRPNIIQLMKLDKSTMSNYLSGRTPVPEHRLDHLKSILKEHSAPSHAAGPAPYPEDVENACLMLNEIYESNPADFKRTSDMIAIVHEKTKKEPVSYKRHKVSSKFPGLTKEAVERAVPEPEQKKGDHHRHS